MSIGLRSKCPVLKQPLPLRGFHVHSGCINPTWRLSWGHSTIFILNSSLSSVWGSRTNTWVDKHHFFRWKRQNDTVWCQTYTPTHTPVNIPNVIHIQSHHALPKWEILKQNSISSLPKKVIAVSLLDLPLHTPVLLSFPCFHLHDPIFLPLISQCNFSESHCLVAGHLIFASQFYMNIFV